MTTTKKIDEHFYGSWRILSTEVWGNDMLDMIQPAFFRFDEDSVLGEFGFVAMGGLDCHYGQRDGKPLVEFTFDGDDEGDPISGRGWGTLEADGKMRGQLFLHAGDDSSFVAERSNVRLAGVPASPRTRRPKRRRS